MAHYSLEPANFGDYRDFLKFRFERMRHERATFSLSVCAKKGGVSKALLQFVFGKKRHLSLDSLPKIARALKLTATEEYYTYIMLCHNSSKDTSVRTHFEDVLNRIRHQYVKVDAKEPAVSQTDDKALYLDYMKMILQAFVRLKGFRADPAWIKEQLFFEISTDQIAECIAQLEKSGHVYRDSEGTMRAKDDTLWRPDPFDPDGQSVYTAGAKAIAALMENPKLYRPSVYSSMSLTFDEENLKQAEKYMIEVHHKLCSLSKESKAPTAVAQIGNYFLTVARLRAESR